MINGVNEELIENICKKFKVCENVSDKIENILSLVFYWLIKWCLFLINYRVR